MARRRTALALRVYRLVRVLVHVAEGVLTTTLVFPWIGRPRKNALIRGWSRRLLRMMAIEPRVAGTPQRGLGPRTLIVANHISWIDIFVIHALQPSRFIAKSELRSWPLVGGMMAGVGTLFIERDSRRHAHEIKQRVSEALAHGDIIAIFPEGKTSDGRQVHRFHSALLQPIVDAGGQVQPIALRYRDGTGEITEAAAYVAETTLLQSFWRMTGEPTMVVELYLGHAIEAQSRHRREVTRDAELAVRSALD
jgi:1-acyl-sn-glycerol-3-phosphate acyltransferase